MGYKFKPSKSVSKRFKVTGTGKLKRAKCFHTHLMSVRDAKMRRGLHRDEILFEGHARNMRDLMGIKGRRPGKVKHDREVARIAREKAAKASA
jgi:large subunit ribosomal protein L35